MCVSIFSCLPLNRSYRFVAFYLFARVHLFASASIIETLLALNRTGEKAMPTESELIENRTRKLPTSVGR
jgi:hypothetical protein